MNSKLILACEIRWLIISGLPPFTGTLSVTANVKTDDVYVCSFFRRSSRKHLCPRVQNKFDQQRRQEITIIMLKKVLLLPVRTFLLNTEKSLLSSETKFSMSAETCEMMLTMFNELLTSDPKFKIN